jgi:hypothetical protein
MFADVFANQFLSKMWLETLNEDVPTTEKEQVEWAERLSTMDSITIEQAMKAQAEIVAMLDKAKIAHEDFLMLIAAEFDARCIQGQGKKH